MLPITPSDAFHALLNHRSIHLQDSDPSNLHLLRPRNGDPEHTILEASAHISCINAFRKPEGALKRPVDAFLLLRLLLWLWLLLLNWCFRLWLSCYRSLGGGRLFDCLLLALGLAGFGRR